jgi:hypothetical protein
MNRPKRLTAPTRNVSSPRKNHSRNPLMASIDDILASGLVRAVR